MPLMPVKFNAGSGLRPLNKFGEQILTCFMHKLNLYASEPVPNSKHYAFR